MLQDRLHTVFFDLLRAGLWGRQSARAAESLSPGDWAEIYAEASSQTVSGLIYAGIENSGLDSMPDAALLAKWAVRSVRIAERNMTADRTVSQLARSLNSEGIVPVLLKGQATAMLYPDPTLRECGDIDLFFRTEEDFAAARRIIGGGERLERMSDGAFECHCNGVLVELHGKMFDMVSPFKRTRLSNAIADSGFRRLDWSVDPSAEILVPAPALNMLMQSLHILRHALCFGIGLRQLCDYAVCYRRLTEAEKTQLSGFIDKLGLRRWDSMLMSFLNSYIYGSSEASARSPLYRIVMETGNFGFAADSRSWRLIISHNLRLFPTTPGQSLTTLYHLLIHLLR